MECFTLKPKLHFGDNALRALNELAGRRVLIVTDAFLAGSGLLDRVKVHLTGSDITVFDQVKPDPSLELVARGVQQMQQCQPDGVIAFGGGSPMDCAKAMRYFAGYDVPLWAVPTTAGTGSEVTNFAVLTDSEKGIKHPMTDDRLLPEHAVLDASLLEGVPPGVTADTGMDVLAHAAEAYVAAGAGPFTDALAERAFLTAYRNLERAYAGENPAKKEMLHASCMAGIAFNNAGLGICHSLSHALGGKYHIPHGRLNGILLPRVILFNAAGKETAQKYTALARMCGLAPSPRALAGALSRLRERLNMPGELTTEGREGLAAAALADRCTATNPRTATQGELEQLLREMSA